MPGLDWNVKTNDNRTPLYFGGTDEQHIVDEGVEVRQGFAGCIADLVIGGVRGGSSGRGRGRGLGGTAARKFSKIVFETSVVDSSNVLDCSSLKVVDNATANSVCLSWIRDFCQLERLQKDLLRSNKVTLFVI